MIFKKYSALLVLFGLATISVVYASDVPIFNFLERQSSIYDGSYFGVQRIETLSGLTFFNAGNNNIHQGNFFRGHYYDPIYGIFEVDTDTNPNVRVQVSNTTTTLCNSGFDGYYLEGQSYNPEFGFMSFNNRGDNASPYICFPRNISDGDDGYLGGYAYSSSIGYQNFDGFTFDSTIDICNPLVDADCSDDGSTGRYVRVEGTVTSQKTLEGIEGQFTNDIRILGKIEKASAKRDMNKKVYSLIRNALPPSDLTTIKDFDGSNWLGVGQPSNRLLDNSVLYIKNPNDIVSLSASNKIRGTKTIIVENGSIAIDKNLTNATRDDILGIIVLKGDAPNSGNIYIDPRVTDIHAIMYAERSLISKGARYDETGSEFLLKDQLYIFGSIMSENTIGGSIDSSNLLCPFYIKNCDLYRAQKYDLNFLRKYKLSPVYDADGNPTGIMEPTNGGIQSEGDGSPNWRQDFQLYPLVIDYNPKVQITPPPLFQ